MRRSIIIACALAIGSSAGWAEDATKVETSTSEHQVQPLQLFDSSAVENKKITDKDGKNLGKLERLLIDAPSGRVRFAVVQVDKEWSLNDPEVIIPWATLQITRSGEKDYALKIDASRDKLMNAPHFEKALVHQLTTREAGQPIYSYWGATWHDEQSTGTARSESAIPFKPSPSAPTPFTLTPNVDLSASTPGTPGTKTETSTESSPAGQSSTAPVTSTDGSAGTQPIGNSGTTDSPRPDSSAGQPAVPSESKTVEEPVYDDTAQPDRTLGGDETD